MVATWGGFDFAYLVLFRVVSGVREGTGCWRIFASSAYAGRVFRRGASPRDHRVGACGGVVLVQSTVCCRMRGSASRVRSSVLGEWQKAEAPHIDRGAGACGVLHWASGCAFAHRPWCWRMRRRAWLCIRASTVVLALAASSLAHSVSCAGRVVRWKAPTLAVVRAGACGVGRCWRLLGEWIDVVLARAASCWPPCRLPLPELFGRKLAVNAILPFTQIPPPCSSSNLSLLQAGRSMHPVLLSVTHTHACPPERRPHVD